MNNKIIEKFESEAMMHIIAENPLISDTLKKQYASAKVIGRHFSGAGFFTDYEVTEKSLRFPRDQNQELGNIQAKIAGLEFGAGFVLFIRDGFIKVLECYTYGEPWPANIIPYSFVDAG